MQCCNFRRCKSPIEDHDFVHDLTCTEALVQTEASFFACELWLQKFSALHAPAFAIDVPCLLARLERKGHGHPHLFGPSVPPLAASHDVVTPAAVYINPIVARPKAIQHHRTGIRVRRQKTVVTSVAGLPADRLEPEADRALVPRKDLLPPVREAHVFVQHHSATPDAFIKLQIFFAALRENCLDLAQRNIRRQSPLERYVETQIISFQRPARTGAKQHRACRQRRPSDCLSSDHRISPMSARRSSRAAPLRMTTPILAAGQDRPQARDEPIAHLFRQPVPARQERPKTAGCISNSPRLTHAPAFNYNRMRPFGVAIPRRSIP